MIDKRYGRLFYMRILFCDDNPEITSQLQRYVRAFFQKRGLEQPEYATYSSGDELLEKERCADIAFLDVEMPGRSGIHVGDQLMKHNPRTKVFIVTSYADYLDEALRFRAFRFLSKPIDKNRLFRNLQDALYQYNIDTEKVPIETADGVIVRNADEILCFEGNQRKTIVHAIDKDYLSVFGIEYWGKAIDLPCMYMSHRNYIVNMKYVHSFDRYLIAIQHRDRAFNAYMAQRKYSDFKNKYLLYLESMK